MVHGTTAQSDGISPLYIYPERRTSWLSVWDDVGIVITKKHDFPSVLYIQDPILFR